MSLRENLDDHQEQKASIVLQRKLDSAQRDARDAVERARVAELAYDNLLREFDLLAGLSNRAGRIPNWLSAPKKAGKHTGTPWLLLSDLHLDEVVEPAEVMHVNAYNRKIAEQRLAETFRSAVKVTRDYWTGIQYHGIVVPLMGDLYAGEIHDELTQTNEAPILDSVLHWTDHLASGISLLADEFGKVHVPVVVGNHGRRSRKPRSKFRARDNFDWFTGKLLERMFANDSRVSFDVSEAADTIVPCYQQKVMVTHGDQARGGGGIAGIWSPITRLDARKRQRQAAFNQPYDLLVMGHWHNLIFGPQFVVNGSLKGYDEYAATENFTFEVPAQALFLMTPEHGKTWTAPIFPMDRTKEKW